MFSFKLLPRAAGATVSVASATLLACAPTGMSTRPVPDRSTSGTSSVGNLEGSSIENLFAGRYPGVTVTRLTDGGIQLRIRGGFNSWYGSNEPLILVDDSPLAPGTRGIAFINPYDIVGIEVLKNPADVAVYGVRGTNGVIRITTKRPGHRR